MKRFQNSSIATRILITGLGISVLAVIVHLALKYISVVIYQEQHGFFFELSNRLDMNDENSVPQWISQTSLLISGLLALLASYMADKKPLRRVWLLLGVFLVALSMDDAATLHEFVLQTLHNIFFVDTAPTFLRNSWLMIIPFLLAFLAWLFMQMVKYMPSRTTIILSVGFVIFFVGALFIDSLANLVPARSFMGQGVLGAVEGGLQLIGISIILYSIIDYLESNHKKSIVNAIKALGS